jgi:hypothetical protein
VGGDAEHNKSTAFEKAEDHYDDIKYKKDQKE